MIRGLLVPFVLMSASVGLAGWAPAGAYLGQDPPTTKPEVFAPGLVSTGIHERDLLISSEGNTIWFGVMTGTATTVLESRRTEDGWTRPVAVGFHDDPEYVCFEPTLSATGDAVVFLSNRAAPGQEQGTGWANQNLFCSLHDGDRWSTPTALPPPVTTARAEYFPSLAADGTLYFSREDSAGHPAIWAAEPADDGLPHFTEPVRLPDTVNIAADCYNATVAPDESWLVLCVTGHPENLGRADYWISFRDDVGAWRPARNMGDAFNGPGLRAASLSVSPDGRYLFFSTNRRREDEAFPSGRMAWDRLQKLHTQAGNGSYDIWWVASEILKSLRAR